MDSYHSTYLRDLDDYERIVGASNEGTVCQAFGALLKSLAAEHKLVLAQQHPYRNRSGSLLRVDGAVVDRVRLVHGYWEAKDTKDEIDAEIKKKIEAGYPTENIIFEDTLTAVLYQGGEEVLRADARNAAQLSALLAKFFSYTPQEVAEFEAAVRQFRNDLPQVIKSLDQLIRSSLRENGDFRKKFDEFVELAKNAIGPRVGRDHVREMLIQHILTEQIFLELFGDDEFHKENNLAVAITALERSFLKGETRHDLLARMEPYYAAIRRAAAGAVSANQKQDFLKAIYEDFYTAYNPKDADRLGIVYTPSEVVKFIIEGSDFLSRRHFGKSLSSDGVDILDPCAGTGTFEVELIEFFRGDRQALSKKFKAEVHSNEISILPYYIASLNVERSLAEALGKWQAYDGACFVNTLENWGFQQEKVGAQHNFLGRLTDANFERIQSQNAKKIPIIIGNPPYNANQKREDDNNKNEAAPRVDSRIRETYLEKSEATKTKLYDPYVRFFRWASDRIGNCGIIGFITNRGFLDKRGYDGFRKTLTEEFQKVIVIDLKGDVRDNTGINGTTHNIFGIQTGVAITFLVRDPELSGCDIQYISVPNDFMTGLERLRWVAANPLTSMIKAGSLGVIEPSPEGHWLNLPPKSWSALPPIGSKQVKAGKSDKAIFRHYSLGISTNRDAWVYDASEGNAARKAEFLVQRYSARLKDHKAADGGIKWSRNLKRRLGQRRAETFSSDRVREANYRPFVRRYVYDSKLFIDERGSADMLFPEGKSNIAIGTIGDATPKPFSSLATSRITDLNFISPAAAGTKLFPLYTYSSDGSKEENITEWALCQFREHYSANDISRIDIFHYVYAVLYDPVYRDDYRNNLKKAFPHIPFYTNFEQWREWGQRLLELHTQFGDLEDWPLERIDKSPRRAAVPKPKLAIKGDMIQIDSITTLTGLPPEALSLRLGNRSAIQWVLDLAKENNPTNRTEKQTLDVYQFQNAKEDLISDVGKVCRLSVETAKVTAAMRAAKRT